MKSNRLARRIVRIRLVSLSVGLVLVIAVEFVLGEVVAARLGQASAVRTDQVQAPNISLGEVLASVP